MLATGPYIVLHTLTHRQQAPHLRIENGVAQPVLPAASSIIHPHVPVPGTSATPQHTQCLKHGLARSRGNSPDRKKMKEGAIDQLHTNEINVRVLFILAERPRLEEEFPVVKGKHPTSFYLIQTY